MKLIYIGPHDAVTVPLPYGGAVEVKHGESANLPNSLAEKLLIQEDNWKKHDPDSKPKGGEE
jgi:hypothetical protein